MIEDAVLTTTKFLEDRPLRQWDREITDDFRQVDLELISGAVDRVI